MKKITYILSVMAIAFIGTGLISSCNKTETVDPTVAFLPDQTSVSKGPGEIITFTVVLGSDENTTLDKLDITRQYGSTAATTFKSEKVSGTAYNYAFVDTIPFGITSVKYVFTVTDNKSKTASKEFVVNVTTPTQWGTISTKKDFIMNNEWVADGQFYGTELLTAALGIADAKLQAAKIDFVFGHRAAANGGAFLAAPSSDDAKAVYDNAGPDKLSTWSTRNNTLFKVTSISTADFDACSNDSLILAATAVGVNKESYKTVAKNEVVAFVTASGRKGIIKVKDVTGAFELQKAGQITFDMKTKD